MPVNSRIHVAAAPAKPVMIYDGECGFCARWIRRWQRATGEQVEYVPYQEPRVARQFPEIAREQLESAVHLVTPEGTVYRAAEAVLRALAFNPRKRRWLDLYQRSPRFAALAEWSYRFVARHRKLFLVLTP